MSRAARWRKRRLPWQMSQQRPLDRLQFIHYNGKIAYWFKTVWKIKVEVWQLVDSFRYVVRSEVFPIRFPYVSYFTFGPWKPPQVVPLELNLASLASVRSFAEQWTSIRKGVKDHTALGFCRSLPLFLPLFTSYGWGVDPESKDRSSGRVLLKLCLFNEIETNRNQ